MKPQETWLIVTVGSAVVAASLAVIVAMAFTDGNIVLAAISTASLILFAACAVTAWTIRTRISALDYTEEKVMFLKLKKPGIERYSEDIVPKGKMPKE